MDPRAHRKLGDEDIAALGKEDGRLCGNHLDVGIRLHDLLNAREGQLVQLVVVGFGLEVVDRLLPVGGQDVAVVAYKALVYLFSSWSIESVESSPQREKIQTFAQVP